MEIPILIEPVAGNGFRSRGGEPFDLSAEGATREEVIAKLRDQVQDRLRNGSQIVALDIPAASNPWVEFAGMFKDDPLLPEWKAAMAEYRRQIDAEPDGP